MQRRLSGNTRLDSLMQIQLTDASKSGELITSVENTLFHMHRGVHDYETYGDAENALMKPTRWRRTSCWWAAGLAW